ncbi:MAG: hypothetical protein FJ134_14690 [Deltaproteobacteria bacterium]|nr:hypothetical protein [Deltaproteobacteria bacterium]
MEQDYPKRSDSQPLLATWIKWTMDFWDSLIQMGPGPTGASPSGASPSGAALPEGAPSPPVLQAAIKMWEAFFSLLSEPQTVSALFQDIHAPSEIILKMAQTGWGAYFHLHRLWLETIRAPSREPKDLRLEGLDQEIFRSWMETYEKDFQRLLNVPQVGLTRLSQEGMNRLADKFYQFQSAMGEFVYTIHLPMKKSLKDMQDLLKTHALQGKVSGDFKDYYKIWIKYLEGDYMTLFQSADFTRAMNKALIAFGDFTLARQEMLADTLRGLPLPTNRDMDELYREVYLLKKQVRELTKMLIKTETSQ